MKDDGNIIDFAAARAGKKDAESIPENNYIITDIDNEEFFGTGFLIFTPHHCAIMKDFGKGAVPVLVIPLIRVKASEIVEDDEENEEIPF